MARCPINGGPACRIITSREAMTDASRGVTVRNPRLWMYKYGSQELATEVLLCRQFLALFLFSLLPWVHSLTLNHLRLSSAIASRFSCRFAAKILFLRVFNAITTGAVFCNSARGVPARRGSVPSAASKGTEKLNHSRARSARQRCVRMYRLSARTRFIKAH
jgi:hypothetical protein